MDGVLLDSELAIRTACVEMFKNRGLTVTPEDFLPFTGMGENRFIGGVAEKYGIPFEMRMKDEAYKIYGEIAKDYIIIFDGIKELIENLSKNGCKLAIASAADSAKVNINLDCMGLNRDIFDAIITGSDVTKHKPDPQVFLMACEGIGGTPARSVVVEDALSGCQAAKNAKMICIGVTSTFSESELKAAGADFVVANTPDILEILEKL